MAQSMGFGTRHANRNRRPRPQRHRTATAAAAAGGRQQLAATPSPHPWVFTSSSTAPAAAAFFRALAITAQRGGPAAVAAIQPATVPAAPHPAHPCPRSPATSAPRPITEATFAPWSLVVFRYANARRRDNAVPLGAPARTHETVWRGPLSSCEWTGSSRRPSASRDARHEEPCAGLQTAQHRPEKVLGIYAKELQDLGQRPPHGDAPGPGRASAAGAWLYCAAIYDGT